MSVMDWLSFALMNEDPVREEMAKYNLRNIRDLFYGRAGTGMS